MPPIVERQMMTLLCIVGLAGCDGKWSTPHPATGPVPLGPPGKRIVRLQSEKPTFEVTYTEIFWDDGHGPVKAQDRVKTITDAAPKELLDRLDTTRRALNAKGAPYDHTIRDGRAVVVSLNPDVLIASVAERNPPKEDGEFNDVFDDWDHKEGRWQIVEHALDGRFGFWVGGFRIYAGPLVPWSDEMYAFSTDPGVPYQRVKFENGQATITLPSGKLVLRRRGIDVDVSRE